jgi:hypothetical protein
LALKVALPGEIQPIWPGGSQELCPVMLSQRPA